MNKGKFVRERLLHLMFPLALLFGSLSWVIVPIYMTNKHFAFMLSEVLVFVSLVVITIQIARSRFDKTAYCNLRIFKTTYGRLSLIALGIITILFPIYRTIAHGFDSDFFSYPRISIYFTACAALIIINKNNKSNKQAILIFVSFILLTQLFYFLKKGQLRLSTIATNINIFACAILLVIPILVHTIIEVKKGFAKIVGIHILLTASIFLLPLTGSRLASYLMLLNLFASIVFERKRIQTNQILSITISIIIALSGLVFVYQTTSIPYTKSTILRAFMLDRLLGIEGGDLIKTDSDKAIFNIADDEVVVADIQKNIDTEQLVRGSDVLRKEIWESAIQTFITAPWFGTGKILYPVNYSDDIKMQGAHNYLLEILVAYGLIGGLAYLNVLGLLFIDIFERMEKKWAFFQVTITYLIFSMLQPTFTTYLLISIYLLVCSCGFKRNTDMLDHDICLDKRGRDSYV